MMERSIGATLTLALWLGSGQVCAQTLALSDPAGRHRASVTASEPAIVWRVAEPRLEETELARRYNVFSPDGAYIGVVYPDGTIRLLNAADGLALEQLRPRSDRRLTYSLALASSGRVAIGRQGSMEVFDVDATQPIVVFPCLEASCVPTSLAFSPDGSLLALYEVTPRWEEREDFGRVLVVDLKFDAPTRMQASAGLSKVAFSQSSSAGLDETDTGGQLHIWYTSDWELPQSMLGSRWTAGSIPADSVDAPTERVAVFGSGSNSLVMRSFADDRLRWAAPLVALRSARAGGPMIRSELERVEIAPNGEFLISYESVVTDDPVRDAAGAIVIRRTLDGAVVETYETPGVLDLAIAPDSETFVYSVGGAEAYTALARIPAF